jgi:hypothetical protein
MQEFTTEKTDYKIVVTNFIIWGVYNNIGGRME